MLVAMIYNENPLIDYDNILHYINEYTKSFGVQDVQVETKDLLALCSSIRTKFPHVDGIEKASAFKKVANFVAHFIQISPIKTAIAATAGNASEKSDINAVVAFDIAIACLEKSSIELGPENIKKIDQPIYISDHSYKDIIEALSTSDICPEKHYQLLAVFFEQIVYKTNRHCEYPPKNSGPTYYGEPFSPNYGDEMSGV